MCKPLTVLWLCAALSTVSAFGQVSSFTDAGSRPTIAPVAYVYVSTSGGQIFAYTANPNGALTAVQGSPFTQNASSMAVNGKYLMSANNNTVNIDALQINSDGSLTYSTSTPCAQAGNSCDYISYVFFDLTGADLYVNYGSSGTDHTTESFAVSGLNGSLGYLGDALTGNFPGDGTNAFFIGNNIFAFSADESSCMYAAVFGFQRQSDGLLNLINTQFNQPTPPPGVRGYYPDLVAADPSNKLAFLEHPVNPPGCAPGPEQIAVYTADSSGNLHTNSTYKNMPTTPIRGWSDMKISPSGKILAVAGSEGLQLFHFNGANPITHYTGLLTTTPINQVFWDHSNHLYGISNSSGQLFVITVTPTKLALAPGSPYSIASPQAITVEPLD